MSVPFGQGLKTKEIVSRKWNKDFQSSAKKDQVETLNEDGEPSGRLIWRIYVQTSYKAKHANYDDRGASLLVDKKEQASLTSLASMKHSFDTVLAEALDCDEVSLTAGLPSLATSAIKGGGPTAPATSSRNTNRSSQAQVVPRGPGSSGTVIDKLLQKVKCPVAACCKVRKTTLREFNNLENKVKKANELCLKTFQKLAAEVTPED